MATSCRMSSRLDPAWTCWRWTPMMAMVPRLRIMLPLARARSSYLAYHSLPLWPLMVHFPCGINRKISAEAYLSHHPRECIGPDSVAPLDWSVWPQDWQHGCCSGLGRGIKCTLYFRYYFNVVPSHVHPISFPFRFPLDYPHTCEEKLATVPSQQAKESRS